VKASRTTVASDGPPVGAVADACYLYGVVPARLAGMVEGVSGVEGEQVGQVSKAQLAALVSPVRVPKVRPTRANLNSHETVVAAAHALGPVLPMRFGTVLPDPGTVTEEFLTPNFDRFSDLLAALEGKDEYRVRGRYLPDTALTDVVRRSRRVDRLRAAVQSAGARARPGDRIELGRLVASGLEALREEDGAAILERLAPHSVRWHPLPDSSDETSVYAALLVERKAKAGLDAELDQLARHQRERMHLELIGPLPAWDFIDTGSWAG
jgi:hypothetical protein